ncbi:VWA domain-containing protein [Candidatus Poribacteria bacterium]|nr:VWA domain-containing protein [Candidatus Poribacteria bacterium]
MARRRRSRGPALISLAVHLLVALGLSVYLSIAVPPQAPTEAIGVEFVSLPEAPRTQRRRVLPRFERMTEATQPTPEWQQMTTRVPQAIIQGPREILVTANPNMPTISANLATVTTTARLPSDVSGISVLQGSPNRPTPGRGLLTGVQRPSGSGFGRNIVNSTGVSATSLVPGNSTRVTNRGSPTGSSSPFANPLRRIGESIAEGSPSGKADAVFVIDTSGSMENNIRQVADSLFEMTDALERNSIDYQLGVVEFKETQSGAHVQMSGMTRDGELLRRRLNALGVTGNERALDALAQTLNLTQFRGDAAVHLILVTDEPATTRWTGPNATVEIRQRILSQAKQQDVRVQVLGYKELFQRQLAAQTGGVFEEIPGGQARTGELEIPVDTVAMRSDALASTFRTIGASIVRAVRPEGENSGGVADIALFVDYSKSMQGRMRAVSMGVSAMASLMQISNVDFTVTVVRFAESAGLTGSGVGGVAVSAMLTDVPQIQQQLAYPAGGDELLLDSVAKGISQVRARRIASRIAVVVTDEPSSGEGVSPDAFVEAIRSTGYRVYAVCPIPRGYADGPVPRQAVDNTGLDALIRAVAATGGEVYPMPEALDMRVPDQ